MKAGKAVNYNGSQIIGLIHLKYGKRTACRDNFFYRECGIFPRSKEKVNNGSLILTCWIRIATSSENDYSFQYERGY